MLQSLRVKSISLLIAFIGAGAVYFFYYVPPAEAGHECGQPCDPCGDCSVCGHGCICDCSGGLVCTDNINPCPSPCCGGAGPDCPNGICEVGEDWSNCCQDCTDLASGRPACVDDPTCFCHAGCTGGVSN